VGEVNKAAEVACQHHASLFHWALVLCRWDREEAMEVVQLTYLEVLVGRADLLCADDPRAYLFGVARRVAASLQRRRSTWGRILRLELPRRTVDNPAATPEEEASYRESASRLRKALARLPVRQLQVLSLVFMEDMTVEQAARVLGISVGSTRTHYHRAKKRVARLMEESDGHAR
jgi:RNA polymerase sigma-70 factor (ECF subfamily)